MSRAIWPSDTHRRIKRRHRNSSLAYKMNHTISDGNIRINITSGIQAHTRKSFSFHRRGGIAGVK